MGGLLRFAGGLTKVVSTVKKQPSEDREIRYVTLLIGNRPFVDSPAHLCFEAAFTMNAAVRENKVDSNRYGPKY